MTRRLARGTISPEREEIERRADHFELQMRRRRRAATMLWAAMMVGLGMVLAALGAL